VVVKEKLEKEAKLLVPINLFQGPIRLGFSSLLEEFQDI
jgi:hypothetical protein